MTETNMNTSNPYDGERRAGTVGFPLPGIEIKITDSKNGETLAEGEIGEIEVRGPNVFSGYWQMPEKTAEELRMDGYFITGDLGTIDGDGYLHISGRNKDVIISGGYKIYPKIVENDSNQYEDKFTPLYKKVRNIKIVQDAMFSSTNEVRGTSYRSRIDDPKYQFAGKTGTAQVKKITERDRELDLKTFQIPYEERDHALYVAFGPYKSPRYALSIVLEHGGSGGTVAAPLAKKLFKMIIDRHEIRKDYDNKKYLDI